jgi:PHP family Zn ribbon phosphoesterase
MSRLSKIAEAYATQADVVRLLGDIGDNAVVAVLDLTPTLAEIEEVAAWLDARDPLMPRQGRPQMPRIAQIIEIADRDDEEAGYLR